MRLSEFQSVIAPHAVFSPADLKFSFPALGLVGEVGEVCNKIKKVYRDSGSVVTAEVKASLVSELGDCFFYLAMVATDMGWLVVDDWVFALPHPVPSLFTAALRLGASVGVVCEMADRQHGGEDIEHVKLPTFAALERTVSLLATCIYHLGTDYATVLEGQVTKIHDRNRRGVVAGNGDHR